MMLQGGDVFTPPLDVMSNSWTTHRSSYSTVDDLHNDVLFNLHDDSISLPMKT